MTRRHLVRTTSVIGLAYSTMVFCCAFGCSNNSSADLRITKGITFHKFIQNFITRESRQRLSTVQHQTTGSTCKNWNISLYVMTVFPPR